MSYTQPFTLKNLAVPDSQVSRLLESQDWSLTPLGALEKWPSSLRNAIAMLFATPTPAQIFWGQNITLFYNDASIPLLGNQHPQSFGKRAMIVSTLTTNSLATVVKVWNSGQPISLKNQPLQLIDYAAENALKYNLTYIPLWDEFGAIAGVLMTAAEIRLETPLKAPKIHPLEANHRQTVSALRQSEERLRVALKSSPITLFNQDNDLHYTWIYNPAFNLEINAVIGKQDIDILPPADAEILIKLKRQVLNTGIGLRTEVKVSKPEQDFYFDLTIEPLRNDRDQIIGITCACVDISHYKTTELALSRSELLLNGLLASSPVGFAFLDQNLRYVHANEALATINGISCSDHIGRTLDEVLPDWSSYLTPILHQVMETKQPLLNQELAGRNTGLDQYHHCLVNYYPVCLPNGQLLGVGVTAMDVTELKATEQALRASEARFRTMADHCPLFIWTTNPEGAFTYINQPWLNFVGQTAETALEFDWLQGVHPHDLQTYLHTYQTGLQNHEKRSLEYRYRGADHQYHWILDTRVPLFHDNGTFLGYISSGVDITDRKHTEQALQEALIRLNFHVENTPLAVIERDRNFHITRWSKAAEKIFGWPASEVIGTDLQSVYEEDLPIVQQVRHNLISGREIHNISISRSYTKNGTIVYAQWYNSALLDDAGNLVSILSLILDITESQKAELERTKLLERAQAARTEAEAANRIKDEFLAVLSHEIRTPLNPILGWTQLLRTREYDRETTERALETIERNAKLQTQLIDDLLDVSRILRGKLRLNVTPVSLKEILKAALDTVHLAAEAKAIYIETFIDETVGQVLGDAGRLQQIVWNILSNAVKFTPTGGRIEIELKEIKGSFAQIRVSDTGEGIDSEFLPYIFEYFRQADASTTRPFGGLGLGLAIARNLVELHGGQIQAASAGEGEGATFVIRLPLKTATSRLLRPETERAVPDLSLQDVQILVVDDEIDLREFLRFVLEQEGAKVTLAASAREALTFLETWKPQILISDIGMPETDGYMLLKQIQTRFPQGPALKAIALTAYASDSDRQKSLNVGFDQHLAKPIEPQSLVKAIAQLLAKN